MATSPRGPSQSKWLRAKPAKSVEVELNVVAAGRAGFRPVERPSATLAQHDIGASSAERCWSDFGVGWQPDVNLEVEQEGDGHGAAEPVSLQNREQQELQLRKQRDDEDALADEHQIIVGKTGPTEELEEWPPRTNEKSCGSWRKPE